MYQYTIDQLQCVLSQTSISNNSFTLSSQTIEVSISNPNSSITNTVIDENQSTTVQMNFIDLQSSSNQQQIATLIASCIQNVIDFASTNPTVFILPPSMTSPSSFSPSSSLAQLSNQATTQVIQSMTTSSVSDIQNSVTAVQQNIVKLVMTNVQYSSAVITITQSNVMEYLAQNIAIATINLILPTLYPSIITSPSSQISPSNAPSPSTYSSVSSNKLKSSSIIIICIVVFILFIILVIALCCIYKIARNHSNDKNRRS